MADLRGINIAMQTPFHEDGSIDLKRWDKLLDPYMEAGMHGFVPNSGTGQHACLAEDECNTLFAAGIKRINGRGPVTAQTSALNLQEVIRRSKKAQDLGADALMILPPFFEGPKHDHGILKFYETVCREVTIDVIGYNIPGATGIELTPALYKRLLEIDNFNFIKDSSGDLNKQQALLACGDEILNGAELNDYISAAKAAARQMGFDGGSVRAPVCELGAVEEAKIAEALQPLRAAQQH